MLEIKSAVQIAFKLLDELYDTRKYADVLLEEVHLSEDKAAWLITIGFSRPAPSINIMESIGSKKYVRTFKQFQINAKTGQLISMTNRHLTPTEGH
jgi:hypothetical protein